jgi:hypothetical protein
MHRCDVNAGRCAWIGNVWQSLLAQGLVQQVAKHSLDSGRSSLLPTSLLALRAMRYEGVGSSSPLCPLRDCECVPCLYISVSLCTFSFLPLSTLTFFSLPATPSPPSLLLCTHGRVRERMRGACAERCRHGFVVARFQNVPLSCPAQ